ncbi:uncharacterized protein TRIADDRAFT_57655 [Trichoplax adhaerens]|uniref:Uncharacterized protein n=1 Tax=Trichoplax adhaerens TaxID=10228 RepID=B3S021_TRIAD|nr:predicted protein [Trichoplax adhaerens]EDV24313.1 predicted protein [Trichoplax adhaerens]|eukprot:XP_002113839.1 predicted protein [Trichoplax adhaerens]
MADAMKQEPSSPVNGIVNETTCIVKTAENTIQENTCKSNHAINGFRINKPSASNGKLACRREDRGEDVDHVQSHFRNERKLTERKGEDRPSKKNSNAKVNSLTYTSDDDVYYKPGVHIICNNNFVRCIKGLNSHFKEFSFGNVNNGNNGHIGWLRDLR